MDTREYKPVSCILLISMTLWHLAWPTNTTPHYALAQAHGNVQEENNYEIISQPKDKSQHQYKSLCLSVFDNRSSQMCFQCALWPWKLWCLALFHTAIRNYTICQGEKHSKTKILLPIKQILVLLDWLLIMHLICNPPNWLPKETLKNVNGTTNRVTAHHRITFKIIRTLLSDGSLALKKVELNLISTHRRGGPDQHTFHLGLKELL